MAKEVTSSKLSNPILSMLLMALAAGVITGLSFQFIIYWPLPVAVAPYFEDSLFPTGFAWGFVSGALFGFILGYLTDESHFIDFTYE
jgi:formate/nitrite transporter FocA (FNT family)